MVLAGMEHKVEKIRGHCQERYCVEGRALHEYFGKKFGGFCKP